PPPSCRRTVRGFCCALRSRRDTHSRGSIITSKMSRSGRRVSTEFLSADGASTVLLHGELPPRTTARPTVPADALPPTQGRREEPYGHGPRAERFRSGRASGRRPRG